MSELPATDAPEEVELREARRQRVKVTLGLFLGPLAAALLLWMEAPAGMPPAAWQVVALTAWMAAWWVLEPVPIAVTALLPVALLPLLGVGAIHSVAAPYANPLIFLFLGGFLLAEAMQPPALSMWVTISAAVAVLLTHMLSAGGCMAMRRCSPQR